MCFLNTYSCPLTCLNAEFPSGQEMTLAAINNLTEIQQHACKITCTLAESYSEGGSTLAEPMSRIGLLTIIIAMAILSIACAATWHYLIKNKEEPPQ